ncbi:MAG TPA: Asp-tRNA(Asn)/Glu-tRNA(Gln) amidotransferase GatCAB subunit B, partial [Anaerolineales bacterium]|nr:Asp-tRNA(Asn)/Glu-tRNA(Gln) amidotransferase GatCAB subunit B [Anaerolineales bacterium]
LERAVDYEIQRQVGLLRQGKRVVQETVGWDDLREVTFTQRVKEGEEDYRYFPEPDLPPLVLEARWVEQIRGELPELPVARFRRFQHQYRLSAYDAEVLVAERAVADYFEAAVASNEAVAPKTIANWVTGDLFALLNQSGQDIETALVSPQSLATLLDMMRRGEINHNTAKTVLVEMFRSGSEPAEIVAVRGLGQISDAGLIAGMVQRVLAENPEQVVAYLKGKQTVDRWLFGQVMRLARGQANPQVIQAELDRQLQALKQA